RKALAQPQAIDCSFAMPMTKPFLPSSSLAFTAGIMECSIRTELRQTGPRMADCVDPYRPTRRLCLSIAGGEASAVEVAESPHSVQALADGRPLPNDRDIF